VTNKGESMGIYIHIPFCLQKCDYCDFYSLPLNQPDLLEDYTRSVTNELNMRQAEMDRPFISIYLGGGTPSLLRPGQVEQILSAIFAAYSSQGKIEISMEMNPATVTLKKLKDYKAAGVNRMSVGVQSFSDQELKLLGRLHDRAEAEDALRCVHQAGFDNFSLDLIYGLPGQTWSAWSRNLSRAVEFEPRHISAYLLQLEPTTPMAQKIEKGMMSLLDDEAEAGLYYNMVDYLKEQGYLHYEISNFARPGCECRHNLLYWQSRPYLGIGCGAVSFNDTERYINQPPLENYISALLDSRRPPVTMLESMNSEERLIDAVVMGLRLTQGINGTDFKHRWGIDILKKYHDILSGGQTRGLLELENDRIYLTKRGYFLSNQVLSEFFS
jgi:putative oxygen-independent coproporphyrinogen III oxidase